MSSAGCQCRLFDTGLVISENASDCTQNAAYRDRKLKKIQGKGCASSPDPSPLGEKDTPVLKPNPLGALEVLDLLPLHFHHFPPIS